MGNIEENIDIQIKIAGDYTLQEIKKLAQDKDMVRYTASLKALEGCKIVINHQFKFKPMYPYIRNIVIQKRN